MKTTNKTNRQADLLSCTKRNKLLALGKKLAALSDKQQTIVKQARRVIGFAHPDADMNIDEELKDAWEECSSKEMILVEYATATMKRWRLEQAVEDMKALMDELGVNPYDLDWNNSYE